VDDPKIQVFVPHYKSLKEEKCKKCGSVISSEKELIRIIKKSEDVNDQNCSSTQKS
jgi:hypothetical protein